MPRGEGGTVEGLEGRGGLPGGASGQCKGPGGDAPGVPEGGLARLREGGGRGGGGGTDIGTGGALYLCPTLPSCPIQTETPRRVCAGGGM